MIQAERCHVRVIDGGESSRYLVEILGDSRLAFLELPPERHGHIDPSQFEVVYDDEACRAPSDALEEPLISGEIVLAHVSSHGDHVLRWQRLGKEKSASATQ